MNVSASSLTGPQTQTLSQCGNYVLRIGGGKKFMADLAWSMFVCGQPGMLQAIPDGADTVLRADLTFLATHSLLLTLGRVDSVS
jgi:hypothetical protein